jgi:Holliday junction resolvase
MAGKETNILKECMLAAAECGAVVWRNNVGMLRNDKGVPVRYGLCTGSSDLIGIYRGRFLAIETKQPGGRVSADQEKFMKFVNKEGGVAFIAYGPDDVRERLR